MRTGACTTLRQLAEALLVTSLPLERWDMPLPTDLIRTMVWDWNVARPEGLRRADYMGWKNMVYGPVTADEHQTLDILRP